MKPTLLTGFLFLLMGTIAHAQLSFLPYAGFEQSRTALNYSNAFSAADVNANLKAGLRMDYQLKGGHRPFINLATSPAPAVFHFDKNGSLASFNPVTSGGKLFRLEAGYLYSSKPIQFKKSSTTSTQPVAETANVPERKSCGSYAYRSRCGTKKTAAKTAPAKSNLAMRLQPSLSLAYIPSEIQNVEQTATGFNYTPGWKTALVPAMGFEFAKGRQRLFTLNVFYTKPMGQRDETVNTFAENNKPVTTSLQPRASTWGLTLGVPFSFTKARQSKAKTISRTTEKKECTRTNYRRCYRMQ